MSHHMASLTNHLNRGKQEVKPGIEAPAFYDYPIIEQTWSKQDFESISAINYYIETYGDDK
jgi:hypothetical protein